MTQTQFQHRSSLTNSSKRFLSLPSALIIFNNAPRSLRATPPDYNDNHRRRPYRSEIYAFPIIRVIHIRAINYRPLIRCNKPSLLVPRLDYNSGRVFDHLVARKEREKGNASGASKYPGPVFIISRWRDTVSMQIFSVSFSFSIFFDNWKKFGIIKLVKKKNYSWKMLWALVLTLTLLDLKLQNFFDSNPLWIIKFENFKKFIWRGHQFSDPFRISVSKIFFRYHRVRKEGNNVFTSRQTFIASSFSLTLSGSPVYHLVPSFNTPRLRNSFCIYFSRLYIFRLDV